MKRIRPSLAKILNLRRAGKALFALGGLLCCLLLVGVALAQTSASYDLSWNVIAGGGGSISSTSYAINSIIGQPVVGASESENYRTEAGFWGGALAVEYKIYLPVVLKNYP
jgi:hypothetical protein